jgi:molybdopterin-containing oxidoreductase family iron-sulfur binding subunit
VVGKERFEKGQAMHWMRIERYWDQAEKDYPEQGASYLPMMCQQCGAATCEPVCPVAATYHTPDGLNAQVYNRCIGSRYCSNNCPFRVRYFNFYSYYESSWPEPLNQQLNPDLTVRDKGVMEKCTFCVQRIRTVKDKAYAEDRAVQDGEVIPACAQSCPTSAIVFGDTLDKDSRVAKLWKEHQVERGTYQHTKDAKKDKNLRGYRIFEELNVDPSVMYLERIRENV